MKSYEEDLYKLVGKEITIDCTVTEGIVGRAVTGVKWLVVKAYPHYVLATRTCENGHEIKECFNIGTLITKGLLSGGTNKEYYKHMSNGWGV